MIMVDERLCGGGALSSSLIMPSFGASLTSLLQSVSAQKLAFMELLTGHGDCKVDACNLNGVTPLYRAAEVSRFSVGVSGAAWPQHVVGCCFLPSPSPH